MNLYSIGIPVSDNKLVAVSASRVTGGVAYGNSANVFVKGSFSLA